MNKYIQNYIKYSQNKTFVYVIISLLIPIFELSAMELPHIILHVDINKTLIAEDKAKGLGADKCITSLLSTSPEYAHIWGDDSEKTTYCKWVDEKLFPISNRDPDRKKKCESNHAQFVEVARNRNHPMINEINYEYKSLMDALETQRPRKVFTSFSNLVTYLKEKNYSFSVILRTFGEDLDWVSQELSQDGLNDFIYGSFCEGVLNLNDRALSNPEEMISAFEVGKHYAIQDSYDWWKRHNLTEKGGKPFPIDISDKRVLSIFFDDNAGDPIKQILNIMPIGEKNNLNELTTLGRVVAVDTRKAILDKNYYINAIEKVLEKW